MHIIWVNLVSYSHHGLIKYLGQFVGCGFPSDWALQPELMNPATGAQMAGVGGVTGEAIEEVVHEGRMSPQN